MVTQEQLKILSEAHRAVHHAIAECSEAITVTQSELLEDALEELKEIIAYGQKGDSK